ncbi:unnamed protein product [Linum tenue]|uniref:Uncharacterized protein n=1 Tax=Linum tenue TaxID=586396 RepID=A0AAV0QP41_9ROSI|nr:unnamed protein product [Linum tenue]
MRLSQGIRILISAVCFLCLRYQNITVSCSCVELMGTTIVWRRN